MGGDRGSAPSTEGAVGRHRTVGGTLRAVSTVLIATDVDRVHDEVDAAIGGDHELVRLHAGAEVRAAVLEHDPVLVVLDLQIGNMGGMATCLDLRLEQRADRLPDQRVVMLLDRSADEWLAAQAEADAWLVKPIDPLALRRTVAGLLANQPT